jgi:hypothetical protein
MSAATSYRDCSIPPDVRPPSLASDSVVLAVRNEPLNLIPHLEAIRTQYNFVVCQTQIRVGPWIYRQLYTRTTSLKLGQCIFKSKETEYRTFVQHTAATGFERTSSTPAGLGGRVAGTGGLEGLVRDIGGDGGTGGLERPG